MLFLILILIFSFPFLFLHKYVNGTQLTDKIRTSLYFYFPRINRTIEYMNSNISIWNALSVYQSDTYISDKPNLLVWNTLYFRENMYV